jgi:GGDEF domain-containing protein/DNA-binding NarL/FixJ family response regulator
MTTVIRVLVAMSSPLIRLRLKHALAMGATIRVVAEAIDPQQTADLVAQVEPHIILCDERVLEHAAFQALFSNKRNKVQYRVVLVTPNIRAGARGGTVPITALLPIDLPAEELVMRLHTAMAIDINEKPPPSAPSSQVTELKHRFVIAEQKPPPPSQRTSPLPPSLPGDSAPPPLRSTELLNEDGTMVLPTMPYQTQTMRQTRGFEDRRHIRKARHDRLAEVLLTMQSSRAVEGLDSITGLGNKRTLGMALRALPSVNLPAAVVVVDLWYRLGTAPPTATIMQDAILRAVGGTLKATVRQGDLICRLDGLTFAIVMPGLDKTTMSIPLQRMREAMSRLRLAPGERGSEPLVAMGVGFWEPGLPPAHPLEVGWQAMLAQRDGGTRS